MKKLKGLVHWSKVIQLNYSTRTYTEAIRPQVHALNQQAVLPLTYILPLIRQYGLKWSVWPIYGEDAWNTVVFLCEISYHPVFGQELRREVKICRKQFSIWVWISSFIYILSSLPSPKSRPISPLLSSEVFFFSFYGRAGVPTTEDNTQNFSYWQNWA